MSHLPSATHALVEHMPLTSPFLVLSDCLGHVQGFVDPGVICFSGTVAVESFFRLGW